MNHQFIVITATDLRNLRTEGLECHGVVTNSPSAKSLARQVSTSHGETCYVLEVPIVEGVSNIEERKIAHISPAQIEDYREALEGRECPGVSLVLLKGAEMLVPPTDGVVFKGVHHKFISMAVRERNMEVATYAFERGMETNVDDNLPRLTEGFFDCDVSPGRILATWLTASEEEVAEMYGAHSTKRMKEVTRGE